MAQPPEGSVPEAAGSDPKEVFAFFGLAAYHAQVLEQELLLFASMLRLSKSARVTQAAVEALFDRLDAKTFGGLLAEARRMTTVPGDLEADLAEALRCRNLLVHRFFADHAAELLSGAGPLEMIEELRGFAVAFQAVD
jgi:hypothetical protein